jgi:hypothetical protein
LVAALHCPESFRGSAHRADPSLAGFLLFSIASH